MYIEKLQILLKSGTLLEELSTIIVAGDITRSLSGW